MADLHDRIRQQYASEGGSRFYQTVMGDGGFDIHYGIYSDPSTSMNEATLAATKRLFHLAQSIRTTLPLGDVLDMGSGRGGPAHFLAERCERVTCVDLCQEHHDENLAWARELGIDDRLHTWLGSFEALPNAWANRFDLVWSQETFCHAEQVERVLCEAFRVTRPGGAIAFTDIMLAPDAASAEPFSDVNAVVRMSTGDAYLRQLEECGFERIASEDWSNELETNFQRMFEQIQLHRDSLLRQGVDEEHLNAFSRSLEERMMSVRGSVLRWGAFVAIRP